MALTGTYERTLDSKQRLAIPRPLKDGFGDQSLDELYLCPGNEGCLSLYSCRGFEEFAARMVRLSQGREAVRRYLRFFYAQSERVQVDSQSRIRIPERLIRHSQLGKETVLIGVQDHIEIWDCERWKEFLSDCSSQFDELTAAALDMTLPRGSADPQV
ncbi:MAG: division/cell wall cluster transcriptional repressor MraZ [Planctomycetaceae bacterium]|jgi:MraZ protein